MIHFDYSVLNFGEGWQDSKQFGPKLSSKESEMFHGQMNWNGNHGEKIKVFVCRLCSGEFCVGGNPSK